MAEPGDGDERVDRLHFAVLGSLRVDGPEGEIVIASGMQRALLAALISRVGAVVSTDRLTEVLWGDDPTPTATKSLQTYVARTRRSLGFPSGAPGPIATRPPGYLLDVRPEAIDSHRFERLQAQAHDVLEHDPGRALALLDQALSLWRGEPWAEFRTRDFAMADAERLDELRVVASEDRFAAQLALGRHESAVGALEAFVADHPYRERPHEQLMVALYRGGRHADALAVYQRFRARLVDELGIEPSEQLRELESAILNQNPELGFEDAHRPVIRTATAHPSEGSAGGPTPVPVHLSGLASRGSFAGRTDEIAALAAAAEHVTDRRQPHLVLVVGEAGIGKSRMVAQAAVALHPRVPTIVFGRCDEERLVPYQPFVESIGELLASVDPMHRATVEPLLGALGPRISTTIAVADSPEARRLLLAGIESVIDGVAPPVMVVVDDLHWADRPSLQVIRHLVRAARRTPVMVVATVRPESLYPGSELAELLLALDPDDVTHIELDGLTVGQAEAIATADFPDAAPLASEAWSRTGGNPFLLRELLRHLVETGAGSLETVPAQLRELVARRVARLEPRLLDVLGAGALLGEAFRLGLAARTVGEEPIDVLDAVDSAVLAGIVVPTTEADEYRFAHALVRDALVQRLGGSRLLHLHLRLAEELERTSTARSLAEVAHHRHAALPEGDTDAAVAAARAAAAQAAENGAHEQAARMFELAISALEQRGAPETELTGDRVNRAETLIRAGMLDGARDELYSIADGARRQRDTALLARAALHLGDTAAQWGVDAQLVALLEEALDLLPQDEAALRSRVTARLAQATYYSADSDRRRSLTVAAEREARRSGDAEALAWVLSASHDALWGPDDVDGRVDAASKIAALGDALGHRELQLRGQGMLVADLMEQGRFAEAQRATERHAAVAHELNQPLHLRDVQSWRATWAQIDGRLDDAADAIAAARALSRLAHDPHGDLIYWVQRFGYVTARRDPDELDDLAEAYTRLAAEFPHVPAWRSALAVIHMHRDDRPAVAAIADEQISGGLAAIPRDVVWMNAVTYLAEAAAYLGDHEQATVVRRALVPHVDKIATVDRGLFCKGAVAHWVGLLEAATGDIDAARQSLTRACNVHRRLGAVLLERESQDALARLG